MPNSGESLFEGHNASAKLVAFDRDGIAGRFFRTGRLDAELCNLVLKPRNRPLELRQTRTWAPASLEFSVLRKEGGDSFPARDPHAACPPYHAPPPQLALTQERAYRLFARSKRFRGFGDCYIVRHSWKDTVHTFRSR